MQLPIIRHREALHYVAGHCTSYYPVQCSPISCIAPSTSATLRSHKLRHGSHSNSHTGHYTSYRTLHLLRDAAPDQNGCTAYGSGAAPTLTCPTTASIRQPASYAPPLSPQSPIPHVIPRRPDGSTPQKPQDFNVLTYTFEASAGELRAKFGGHTRTDTQLTIRESHHQQTTPAAIRPRGA